MTHNHTQDNLICKQCGWQTPKWTTNAKGEKKSGWGRLSNHMSLAHQVEVDFDTGERFEV